MKQAMINAAREIIVVADHSKFDRQVFAHLCDVKSIYVLITDRIDAERRDILEQRGVRVITPDSPRHSKAKDSPAQA